MEGARLKWRRATTAALLNFLPLTLLIPGAFALQCHSYTSIQPVSRDQISSEFFVAPSVFSTCSASQNACVEAHLMLSTEKSSMLVTHRGCASEELKDETRSSTSGNQHLTVHSSVHYCHGDLCNGEPKDLNAFKMPEQEKASEASGSNQCYSGFTLDSDQDILDRVMCGKDYSQCYHGNGTITVGHLMVDFLIKTCQEPSCDVPESQSFGPIKLKLWGSCCHGIVCNGEMVAPQESGTTVAPRDQTKSIIASTQYTTQPQEEDATVQPTDFPRHVVNGTEGTLAVSEEVSVTLDPEWDIDTRTTPLQNEYDEEEEFEGDSQLAVGVNNTLNPRAANLGPPKPGLSFYSLLVALGITILRIL